MQNGYKRFITDDFLLTTPSARILYHEYAAQMPIIDYHCHLSPKEIYEDRHFDSITQIWLGGDHYKWRLMRANGIDETYITGDACEREKFQKFAETLPKAIGNPLYHWCHLELSTYFDYHGVLNKDTAEEVWQHCNRKLAEPALSTRAVIARSNVVFIGTTDDPLDTLEWHEKTATDTTFSCTLAPSFRPDNVLNIEKTDWKAYLAQLGKLTGIAITDLSKLETALRIRMEYFHAHGCKAADHGLDYLPFAALDRSTAAGIMHKALNGEPIRAAEVDAFKTYLLFFCATSYYELGWIQQWHYNCRRNPNSRMFTLLGPDTGFDLPDTVNCSAALTALLDSLSRNGTLPKTVLYSLNPTDNLLLAATAGSFQDAEAQGKIQHGTAWWFNDTKQGITAQMEMLASVGLLGNFIGMVTDSRSFLSYARHAYFRRILCRIIGQWIDEGEYPNDIPAAGSLVQAVCYGNVKKYLGI